MTDHEMLKLAAKSAGIKHPGGDHSIYNDGRLWDCAALRWWNPLTDDGDALRLAVALGIFHVNDGNNQCRWVEGDQIKTETTHDHISSVRRGIVRAAAVIGARMSREVA